MKLVTIETISSRNLISSFLTRKTTVRFWNSQLRIHTSWSKWQYLTVWKNPLPKCSDYLVREDTVMSINSKWEDIQMNLLPSKVYVIVNKGRHKIICRNHWGNWLFNTLSANSSHVLKWGFVFSRHLGLIL